MFADPSLSASELSPGHRLLAKEYPQWAESVQDYLKVLKDRPRSDTYNFWPRSIGQNSAPGYTSIYVSIKDYSIFKFSWGM